MLELETVHQHSVDKSSTSLGAGAGVSDSSAEAQRSGNLDDTGYRLNTQTPSRMQAAASVPPTTQPPNMDFPCNENPIDASDNKENDFHPDDADIMKDAATARVALVVHMALIFFAGMVVVAMILAVSVISSYGFVTFLVLSLFLLAFVSLAWFVDKTLKDEARLKPVRRKIKRWKALATAVVLQEVRNFQLEWHEHLLLTDGNAGYDLYDDEEEDADEVFPVQNSSRPGGQSKSSKKKSKSKSVLFKLVKPFLRRGGRRRKKKAADEARSQPQKNSNANDSNEYNAPGIV